MYVFPPNKYQFITKDIKITSLSWHRHIQRKSRFISVITANDSKIRRICNAKHTLYFRLNECLDIDQADTLQALVCRSCYVCKFPKKPSMQRALCSIWSILDHPLASTFCTSCALCCRSGCCMMVSPCICSRSFKKAWMNSKFELDSSSDLTMTRREPRAASLSTLASTSRTCLWQQTQSQDLSRVHEGHCSYHNQRMVEYTPAAFTWKITSHMMSRNRLFSKPVAHFWKTSYHKASRRCFMRA